MGAARRRDTTIGALLRFVHYDSYLRCTALVVQPQSRTLSAISGHFEPELVRESGNESQ